MESVGIMENRKKTYIADIERGVYDIKDEEHYRYKVEKGLTPEIIKKISERKNEPEWMKEFRLKALEVYNSKPMTDWGPDLSDLDVNDIVHYLEPDSAPMNENWDDVPSYIRDTFDRLGIPEAEKQSLAGVGAQYDSEVVYHSIHKELKEQGVIYTDIETAMVEYEDGKISQVRIDPFGRASGSTVRKLFRMLHERLRRVSSKVSDESIRYHYRYTFRTADGTQYVRAFIEEAVQGKEGYHLYLSCDRNKHYK